MKLIEKCPVIIKTKGWFLPQATKKQISTRSSKPSEIFTNPIDSATNFKILIDGLVQQVLSTIPRC